ncbi:sigma factor [Streptomyces sp. NPDC058291]|uniref:sigma factor n=1 Tax=Streptomyces sp. NPDC058291 TaxID=3346427 RepID=UPI0036E2FFED
MTAWCHTWADVPSGATAGCRLLPRLWQAGRVTSGSAEEFTAHRPRMFGLAYRLLGSAEEAEDAVQDAYLRWSSAVRTPR